VNEIFTIFGRTTMRHASPIHRAEMGRRAVRTVLACCILGGAMPAIAQQVYRSVDAQGRVVYSDRDPGREARDAGIAATSRSDSAASGRPALPYELRLVAQRFPVVLYTGPGCGTPCDSARQLLADRGVPHTEHTVSTAEDVQALRRLSGGSSLPFATIGRQPLEGFSPAEWGQYLDAAQYPRRSELPAGYRQPAATPLVAVAPARAGRPAEAPAMAPSATPEASGGPSPANPAGIRF
jgi:hypothetical protein